jgi:hypothetical protein
MRHCDFGRCPLGRCASSLRVRSKIKSSQFGGVRAVSKRVNSSRTDGDDATLIERIAL